MRLRHLGVDGFDDDDRVVDDDADGQDHREEGDQVDGEAHQLQDEEAADEGHRHRERRDERGAQVAQEHVDDERHQDERLEQGVQHLLDGGVDEAGDVVGDLVVHPRGERLLQLLERLLDLVDDLGRVGTGRLLEDHGGRGIAVDVGVEVEELRAELDALVLLVHLARALGPRGRHADVSEAQDLPVRLGLQDDVRVLLRLVVAADVGEHVLLRLRGHARGLTEAAGRADDALFRHGLHDVVDGDVVGPHAVGIQPDAHREISVAEISRDPHALDTFDHGHDVDVGVVE